MAHDLYRSYRHNCRLVISYGGISIIQAIEIYTYWNSLTVYEKLTAIDEYFRKYGHLLPNETTEGSAIGSSLFLRKYWQSIPKSSVV